jgi:hypothetical protein
MGERDLLEIGFSVDSDGVLNAPLDSRVKLVPVGQFYELRISLGNSTTVLCVVSKAAIKITGGIGQASAP